jgi:hypothetical protein
MNQNSYSVIGRLIGLPIILEPLSFTLPRVLIPTIAGAMIGFIAGSWLLGFIVGWIIGLWLVCFTAGIHRSRSQQ